MAITKDPFANRSVPRTIIAYAIPTILSQLVTMVYNLADTFFVGHTNNPAQVAALTFCFPLFMTMTMIGNLFGIGANSLISRSLGARNEKQARETSAFAFYGGLFVMLIWIILLKMLMPIILPAIGAITEESYLATKAYLTWTVVIGGLPTVASLLIAHCIRGEGNTKQASIGVSFGAILNIILDPIFVQGFGMGVAGAGIATCISNTAALIYFLILLSKNKESVVDLSPARFTLKAKIAKEVVLVGLPAAAVVFLGASANVVLTHLMAAHGEICVAAYGVTQKLSTVTMQITVGLTQGIMPLLGYSFGARNMKRVKEINRWSFLMLGCFSGSCLAVFEAFPRQMMLLFTAEEQTVQTGSGFMRIYMLCVIGMTFIFLLNSIFQAMGKWQHSLLLSFIRQGFFLIPLLICFNHFWGATGLVMSQPVADTAALIIGLVMYGDGGKAS